MRDGTFRVARSADAMTLDWADILLRLGTCRRRMALGINRDAE
jgi:hypothetical protein